MYALAEARFTLLADVRSVHEERQVAATTFSAFRQRRRALQLIASFPTRVSASRVWCKCLVVLASARMSSCALPTRPGTAARVEAASDTLVRGQCLRRSFTEPLALATSFIEAVFGRCCRCELASCLADRSSLCTCQRAATKDPRLIRASSSAVAKRLAARSKILRRSLRCPDKVFVGGWALRQPTDRK